MAAAYKSARYSVNRSGGHCALPGRYNPRVDHLLRATADAEARHFWFRGFRLFVAPLLQQATTGISDVLLLDCGCGTGANAEWLNHFGRAYGFDLSPVGLRIGHTAGRRRLARATVLAVPFPTSTFDVVTSFDVIYSLETADERAAVAEMYRVVKPGGFVQQNFVRTASALTLTRSLWQCG